ncbi:cystathionine beta-lyase [Phreatobacter sp.]|uniref:cystathionine beta-lyase n=1 Tax=Phreatobacter sp. TaxID=1966341 RepID=UPI003F717833
MRDATRCVHHPAISEEGYASLAVPTHRASTIVYPDAASFLARHGRGPDGYSYGLSGTPTTRRLEAQLTALHGGARTLLVPSGQAAASLPMLALLKPGDSVLIPDSVYPPVRAFCRDVLGPLGIGWRAYDPLVGAAMAGLIDDTVRLIWMESPGSGTMEVQDVPAIVAAAKARGVLTGCDNTWATALNFKPLAHGVDIVAEALTKYAGGHSDLLMGAVTVADIALRDRIKALLGALGIGVSPDEAALALRGLETMAVRLAHAGRVAADFARRLQDHPAVERVLHPALPSCPGHSHWTRDFAGVSGLFSVLMKPGTAEHTGTALDRLKVFAIGASWGGTRSLVAPMAVAGDRTAAPWTHEGALLRISIGLEDADDLWADLAGMIDGFVGR